jgi:predicted phage terminase large subunit-like protein
MANVLYHGVHLTLFRVAKHILGYGKMTEDKHQEWANNLEKTRKKYKRMLYLKPRATYKTTLYSVSNTIDQVIEDWVQHDGTFNNRILICSATDEMACQILGEVKQHLKENAELTSIFGYDIIDSDNKREVWFKNRTIHKEPNIKAKGALAALVSEHYDIIIVDDLCNNDDRESDAVREKKKRWFIDLISILEPGGELLVIGTRWHEDDVYNMILEMNNKLSEEDKYHIEVERIITDTGEPLFPSIYTIKDIERLKIEKGLVEFYAQYMNEPLPSETRRFDPEKFQYYTDYGLNDQQFSDARHFAYVDPALGKEGDYTIIFIGAVKGKELYLRDAFISNTTTPDASIGRLEYFYKGYEFLKAGIETNAFQSMYADAARKRGIPVEDVHNNKKKEIRIDSIEPFVNQGQIKFREDWNTVYPELIEQLARYPVHKYDDGPDALEGLIRISLKGGMLSRNVFKDFLVSGVSRFGGGKR